MSLHLFSSAVDDLCIELLCAIMPRLGGGDQLHVHRSVAELTEETRLGDAGGTLLTMIRSDDELDQLLAVADQLSEQRLVVLLHDASASARSRGHRLRPRVLFSPPIDVQEIGAVVARLLSADLRQRRRSGGGIR